MGVYRGFSLDVNFSEYKNTPKKTENSHHVGLRDGSFYGDLSECKETLRMVLVCVELGKILPLRKLKQLN